MLIARWQHATIIPLRFSAPVALLCIFVTATDIALRVLKGLTLTLVSSAASPCFLPRAQSVLRNDSTVPSCKSDSYATLV